MKIYDCFMFFDEEMLLDLRLNIMDKYVDKFVITEAAYMHSGKRKKLQFNIDKYKKFKDKIIYIKVENEPKDLYKINEYDTEDEKNSKIIDNAIPKHRLEAVQNYVLAMTNFLIYKEIFHVCSLVA